MIPARICARIVSARRCSSAAAAAAAAVVDEPALKCGAKFRMERAFTEDDLRGYAALSRDSNPIHTELSAAQAAGFRGCVVHGMLTAGMFPAIIGSKFPGAIYRTQSLNFHEPAFAGDNLLAEVTILSSVKLKRRYKVTFATSCFRSDPPTNPVVLDGVAVAVIPL